MVQIKRIVSSGQISDFRPSAPDAGGGFRLLADGFDALYDRVLPIAVKQEGDKGAADFRGLAKAQIGGQQVYASSSGGGYRDAIASIESGGRYDTVGPTDPELGRALGKYQVMEANIGPWSREALGREVTAEEFLADPGIQDAIFDHKFGSYVAQFGEEGAAQAWFAGPGGVGKTSRKDVLGTDVGSYGQMFMSALGGASGSGSTADPAFTPTMLRDADGALVSKLYDPSSDPIKQAYNMAAMAGYQSEIFLKSTADLMAMREQFAQDPDGFMQAAEAYMDGIVDKAPTLFQTDMRDGLTKEVQQVFLGLLDDQHQEIRQRASNSNQALIEKWSDSLGAAIAGGDPKEIAAAQSQLTAALSLRERLPGLAWTPEQSDNVVQKAQEDGQRRIEKKRKDAEKKDSSDFDVALSAAKNGMTGEAEGRLLSDPLYGAMYPDRVAELRAWAEYRDLGPTFDSLSLDEQEALAAKAFGVEPQNRYEIEIAKAFAARVAVNRKARETETRIDNTKAMLRDSSTEWNPYDSDQRKLIDEAFGDILGDADPLSEEGQNAAAAVAMRTGFVPKATVDAMRRAIHAGDPVELATAMEFAGQVSRDFPSIFGVTDGGKEVTDALSDYRFYSRYMSAEEAGGMMVAADLPENVERRERLAPLAKEKVKALTPKDIEGHFGDRGVDVTVPADEMGAAIMGEYQRLFEDAFVATGNADMAKQRALESISRVYGPSGIDGSEMLMRYPPTSFYPARDGSHDWMRDQLEKDVTSFATGVDVAADEETRNWFGGVKGGIVGSDRIRMVSDAGTQDDVAAGRAPSYQVQFLDDDEVWQLVPGRYRFEIPSQFTLDKGAFDRERQVQTERSNIEAWKEYLIQDPNRTKTIPDIDEMLSKNRDHYISTPPPEGY
jgi:hypothetical protein